MKISRGEFYVEYRNNLGRIENQETVDTINSILDRAELEQTPVTHISYMLATSLHEARDVKKPYDFSPITERGNKTYITKLYWDNTKVRGWLGNKTKEDAWNFRGRGLVQLTGRVNYERFGISDTPEKALEPDKAVEIMFEGMKSGTFTGKKLTDYLSGSKKDYYNARRIINGTDKARTIAGYAEIFERIINNSIEK